VAALVKRLQKVDVSGAPEQSATTMALALFDLTPRHAGYNVLAIWAGDSRVYAVNEVGNLWRLTSDHHSINPDDGKKSICSFFRGDGLVVGKLEGRHYVLPTCPAVICVSSDGVHERCRAEELRHFLLYCVDQRIAGENELRKELRDFLGRNVGDNFSLALVYRRMTSKRVLWLVHHGMEMADATPEGR
jgi:hypothetical protein